LQFIPPRLDLRDPVSRDGGHRPSCSPAQAGVQDGAPRRTRCRARCFEDWTPAFAGEHVSYC
jgi:hypothetical protein